MPTFFHQFLPHGSHILLLLLECVCVDGYVVKCVFGRSMNLSHNEDVMSASRMYTETEGRGHEGDYRCFIPTPPSERACMLFSA